MVNSTTPTPTSTTRHLLSSQYITCIRVYAWGLCVGGRLTHHLVSDTDRVLTKINHSSPGLDYRGILEQMDVLGGKGLADWLQQGRCENEIFLSALVLYLFQWIDGIDKVVDKLYRRTCVEIELSSGPAKGELRDEDNPGSASQRVLHWFQTKVPVLETVSFWSKLVGRQNKTEGAFFKVRHSTIPLLDTLRTHIKHYKTCLPSVLGLGDVSGNPIPLDAQYLAEEMNMKIVLGNSRLVEAFPAAQGLARDWIDGALMVTAIMVRSIVWWSALLGEQEDSALSDGFEEMVGGGGVEEMDFIQYLEQSRFQQRLQTLSDWFSQHSGDTASVD
ncbi:hypothetical protein LXG23DRAFT_55026 [Yarrowia lipolytica]|uniref:Uncharacterized protein n=1 Tax=Yarrowia lipolytica TaxID=4952 RepID=A0A1D8NB56_YARLL|nr:hypothetical protein YALI1_C19872g [Yarrowia lipolytica]KAB8280594.1 hypothetical protein BKA91DRAFT_42157 [Yarrowia lipolytica]KAE8169770.1 hypothetical protein BKA90DRAFT_44635 [Yarrowia lipolytica]KAJ8053438.1 hypothetical protein LXG23DRAFT_55026 [Yarrowia lipolytica]RMI95271.1 hypothetical protein BD777DRAFT_91716 [Yarrowia lipolytica]